MKPGDDEFKEIESNDLSDGADFAEIPDASEASAESEVEFPAFDETFESNVSQTEVSQQTAESTVTVQPVQFASFEDLDQVQGPQNQNLNILLDVKLQLTVELGRTELPIKKVLELTKGSIVTLNKAAGEPVELFANGKLIAYGEVVVIEDNFGLRITHITDPAKRLNSLGATQKTEEVIS
jgi:flagellar motor switch protein FliN/FliY